MGVLILCVCGFMGGVWVFVMGVWMVWAYCYMYSFGGWCGCMGSVGVYVVWVVRVGG